MRDPERIDPVIDCIRSIWRRYPDLRLMQLLGNAFPDGLDPYHVEDDKTVELLDKTYPVEPPSPNGMALDFESSTTAGSNPVGGTTLEYAEGDCEICLHDGTCIEEEPCFTCLRDDGPYGVGKWERNPDILTPPSPNRNGTRLRTEHNTGSNPVGGAKYSVFVDISYDQLALVGYRVPREVIATWPPAFRGDVEEWAIAVYRSANNDAVAIPARPECLDGYEPD